jgi:hypothetical protein
MSDLSSPDIPSAPNSPSRDPVTGDFAAGIFQAVSSLAAAGTVEWLHASAEAEGELFRVREWSPRNNSSEPRSSRAR